MLKPELQVKFLNHLNRRNKKDEGFTLIELLVVVIIIGVLAAIALPSLLSQVSKARQSEAKQNIGSMNRAQQAFFLENNNAFTTELNELALGIRTQTDNYKYEIAAAANTGSHVSNKARSVKKALKSYIGVVYTSNQSVNGVNEAITLAVLCESVNPATTDIANGVDITNGNNNPSCPNDATGAMKTVK
ncbi:general secretion pathway protein GspH [Scytonema hofmannii PCC 7110]|uniref:General secretion pathway protein GspH n=1 Tax=Scytonema hofmannii PCC 7110 TaxID=128403 RepID=A0A139XEH5_9CYAN|nr:type IV pilin-like G/H family protein [Scytonema hofmannii]KYC43002.1 general secretion pathway protein GspH [Scytonema hofmannii PCC 7110]